MRNRRRDGFTIIELMVSLVVAGLLMASLVALSGSVQRTFSRSKDITDLQANLRFAMKVLAEDLSRAGFMYSPDARQDNHMLSPPTATGNFAAITYAPSPTATTTLTLMGNYMSTRAYKLQLLSSSVGQLLCNLETQFDSKGNTDPSDDTCNMGGFAIPDQAPQLPFRDGAYFDDVFKPGQMLRLEVSDRRYIMTTVQSSSFAQATVTLNTGLNRNLVPGDVKVVNPVNTIQYQVLESPAASGRWILQRVRLDTDPNNPTEIAEFLLPQDDPFAPGFSGSVVNDTAAPALNTTNTTWLPVLGAPVALDAAVSPQGARALVVTLRGRTQFEDPSFQLGDYTATGARNFGFDLDNNPDNGLAHVRVERFMVQIRNLAMLNEGL